MIRAGRDAVLDDRSADIPVGGFGVRRLDGAFHFLVETVNRAKKAAALQTRLMRLRMPEMPPANLLAALGSHNLLPAIVFLPTRRRCDEAATEAALSRRGTTDERREERREFMRSFVEQHPEIRRHRHWDAILRGGIASHHAGHLPAWKLVIEKMMSAGLLDAIFATATVAAGVDFPARTVV